MNPLRARAGSALALALALVLGGSAVPVAAQDVLSPNYWFAGTRLAFDRPQTHDGTLAISSDDYGLGRFLTKLSATLSFQPGQKYIVITSGDHRTVTFTLGDRHYTVDGVAQTAAFAPYVAGGGAFLPFLDLARALYVAPVKDGPVLVLQPQIAALDVRSESRMTIVTLRGASPLHFKRLSDPADSHVSLAFIGTGSTLERDRQVSGVGLRAVSITVGGTSRNPTTVVNFDAPAGSVHVLAPSDTTNSLSLAFAPNGIELGGTSLPLEGDSSVASTPLAARDPSSSPPPPPPGPYRGALRPASPPQEEASAPDSPAPETAAAPADAGSAAAVTAFDTVPTDTGLNVRVQVSGPVSFQWHRLTDNRWYVDLKPATLAVPPQDQNVTNDAVLALRLKGFVGPKDGLPTVRIAFTLASPRAIDLVPSAGGLTIAVSAADDANPERSGAGDIADGRITATALPSPPPETAQGADGDPNPEPTPTWKFAPPAGTNPKLIVIDPGHGGSDFGAMHNGLVEKDLTLDISRRLRTILVARGWQVKMTRDADVDVYEPNDSAHDELQARDDVANQAGARLFVSVHCNAFETSALSGTTTYYYNPDSYALAGAVHARLIQNLGTKNDGVRKDNFYVIHHAKMPAILIEAAFLSNPGDAALLHSAAFLQKIASSIADGVGDYASPSQPLTSANTAPDGL
jgi:N-acetylmuramoyl-L-alanine amidase